MTKRRAFTPEFKARLVLEELTGIKSTTEIYREHRLKPQVFSRWKAEFIERAPEIFATKPSRGDEQERIAELERMVGRRVRPTTINLPEIGYFCSQSVRRFLICRSRFDEILPRRALMTEVSTLAKRANRTTERTFRPVTA